MKASMRMKFEIWLKVIEIFVWSTLLLTLGIILFSISCWNLCQLLYIFPMDHIVIDCFVYFWHMYDDTMTGRYYKFYIYVGDIINCIFCIFCICGGWYYKCDILNYNHSLWFNNYHLSWYIRFCDINYLYLRPKLLEHKWTVPIGTIELLQ